MAGDPAVSLELQFLGVSGLQVSQNALEQQFESDTLSEFIYSEVVDERGLIHVSFMDGLTFSFQAAAVTLLAASNGPQPGR